MSLPTRPIADAVSEYITELSQTRIINVVSGFGTIERANEELRRLTGICCFFESRSDFEEFRQALAAPSKAANASQLRAWGDFQTPPDLAMRICRYLAGMGAAPELVIEPTFGAGSFIFAALATFPTVKRIYGVEIQEKYVWLLKIALLIRAFRGIAVSSEIDLRRDDIFTHNFPASIDDSQNILIIGNPPWVTNAELGVLEAGNLPKKQNIKAFNGLDALTGKSNFDIAEFILLQTLERFSHHCGTLAMLCKTAVMKNLVEALPQRQYRVSNIRALEIDANREFNVNVEACLLVMDLGTIGSGQVCQVATLDNPGRTKKILGWTHGRFVSDIENYEPLLDLDGESVFIWRQGVKHDSSKIMELGSAGEALVNGNGEVANIEEEFIYPLLKSSDLREFEVRVARKKVIITQSKLGEDTSRLEARAPKLWEYLVKHGGDFDKRKSNIYRNRPRFSIFGIGEYSFKPYKVAISGLYKDPVFSLVSPMNNRPVLLDDTCYFLGFDTYVDALLTNTLLNGNSVRQLLRSIVFTNAKRPYTKEVLMRIDLSRVAATTSFETLQRFWSNIHYELSGPIGLSDWEKYQQTLLTR